MANSWYDYDEYLKAKHLKGKRHVLTIRSVGEVKTNERGKESIKPVLYFVETKKYLFMDSANRREAIVTLFGDDPKNCIGKKIAIAAGKAPNGKDTIDIFPASASAKVQPIPDNPANIVWEYAAKHHIEGATVEQVLAECNADASKALDKLVWMFEQQPA